MKISEIQNGMSNIAIEGKIIDVSDPREVNTRYGQKRVADATLEDDSGTIKLSLWEGQIDSVKVGDRISISGGYVTEFRDAMQLNLPRSGKLDVL
ncbi:MAG: OB-fold nucleic acid binding domain-containing protein [Candidatus Aenigmatarchaeota archaeon]